MYNLLIADDENIEREAIEFFVQRANLPIASIYNAENGNKVIECCQKRKIDIIILDIRMPVLSGLDALEKLRNENYSAKVIISTAYSQFDYAVKALQLGATDFLVKPVEEEILIESLRNIIQELREREEKEEKINAIGEYLRVRKESIRLQDEEQTSTVKQICQYIENNYYKRIGLEEIAEDSGYSKFHINKIFRAEMNTTVVDYLIHYRIQKAKELLSMTNESIKSIAFRTGYSDPNYFTWTFKKLEGISPLQYKAKHQITTQKHPKDQE